jgi:hypothetical protein
MVQINRHDDRQGRGVDDVCRIKPSTKSHL